MSKKTKLKIMWTNIKRVIMSILFVNLSFATKAFAKPRPFDINDVQITCYAVGPIPGIADSIVDGPMELNNFSFEHVFIILVPVALIIGFIIYIVKKHKNKSKKEESNDKQD